MNGSEIMGAPDLPKNESIHICDRSKVNLSVCIHHCGQRTLPPRGVFQPDDQCDVMGYIVSGSARLTVRDGISVPLHEGQLFLASEGFDTRIENDDAPCALYFVGFSGYLLQQYLIRMGFWPHSPIVDTSDREATRTAFDELVTRARHPSNRYCRMLAILYDLFGKQIDYAQNAKYHIYEPFGPKFHLTKALVFISNHFSESITVEDVAKHVGVSRKYLYAIFKDLICQSPRQYMLEFRMNEACRMFNNSRLSVNEVARGVGYADQFQFSKMFRKATGMPPSQYRKNHPHDREQTEDLDKKIERMEVLLRERDDEIVSLSRTIAKLLKNGES